MLLNDLQVWYTCTMLLRKALRDLTPPRDFTPELKYLYRRRDAVDSLIRSLYDYDRYVPRPEIVRKKKTA